MKIVIFAGGVGTRLWPLSRKNTPKQFEKIMDDQSMLQVSVSKLFPDFSWQDIYISTNKQYEGILKKPFPKLIVAVGRGREVSRTMYGVGALSVAMIALSR